MFCGVASEGHYLRPVGKTATMPATQGNVATRHFVESVWNVANTFSPSLAQSRPRFRPQSGRKSAI